jgi:glycosyltransferase involved in cell wall biosynthesis
MLTDWKVPMKIVVVEGNGTGGLAHFAYQMCNALADQGTEVVLITSTDYELAHMPHRFAVEAYLRLWSIHDSERVSSRAKPPRNYALKRKIRRVARALRFAAAWQKLIGRIRSHSPDVVQFGIIHFPFQWVYLDQLKRQGLVLTQVCHEFEGRDEAGSGRLSRILRQAMFRRVYGDFSAIMFLAKDTRTEFLALHPEAREICHVIPHGTQELFAPEPARIARLRETYGIGLEDRVVLFFGTIRPSKGLPDLLDAFAAIPSRRRTKLVIAGFPNKYANVDEIRHQVSALGLDDEVILDIRYVPNEEVGSLVALGDVVVFPYRNATQSGALHLAYSLSRPIVATRVGGLAEDLTDDVTGLSVPVGDVRALAAAIDRLLCDRALADRLAMTGHARAQERNSWEAVSGAIIEIYRPFARSGIEAVGFWPKPRLP